MNTSRYRLFVLLATVCLSLTTATFGFGQSQSPVLSAAGQQVERDLKGGESHVYSLTLAADTYLHLIVSYQGLSADMMLHDTEGKPWAEWRGKVELPDTSELAVVATTAGKVQLVVRGRGAATGKYKLEIKAWRAATEQDRQYATAQRLSQEANALIVQRTAEGRQQGVTKLRAALPLWRASGALRQELETLRYMSDTLFVLGEFPPAMEAAQELLTKARAAGLRYWELKGLRYVGVLHNSLNEFQATRQTLEPALLLSRELKERLEERVILNSLGIAVAALGQRHLAIEYYQQALVIAREIGDRSGEATMLRNLAVRYEGIGEPDQALAHYQQALALRRELGLRDSEATTLLDLSRVQMRRGELQPALELATQAQALLHAAGRKNDEANALDFLSRIHYAMREFELALAAAQQALVLYRESKDRAKEAGCLRLLSAIHQSQGETVEAGELLQQALIIHRAINIPNELMQDLLALGSLALDQSQPQQALGHLAEALALSRQISQPSGEAQVMIQMGRAHRALGETDQARDAWQQALTLSRTIKHHLLEAEVEHDLAQLALQQGRPKEAQTQIEAALSIIENARDHLVNPTTRAEYRSHKQSYYEIYLESLLRQYEQQGDARLAAQALEAVERARARVLLELLAEARIDIRQGIAPELLNTERALQQRLSAKAELLQRAATQKNGQEQAKQLAAEITTLSAELRAAESRIRIASPAYAALTQPQPLTLTEIQQQVLTRDTLLLEYALGTERSYLFAVTPTSLKIFTLPKRAEIEAAARRWHELLSRRNQPPAFDNLAAGDRWFAQLERDSAAAGATLSRLILQPVAAELPGKRLLLVPDGVLHYVPFAALPVLKDARGRWKDEKKQQPSSSLISHPLIVAHELLTLPSASTLAVLRRERANRQPAPQAVAVLADPVFEINDERLQAAHYSAPSPKAATASLSTELQRAVAEVLEPTATTNKVPTRFFRLPYTRAEANAIGAVAPKAATKLVLDFAANRAAVTSGQLEPYRFVHFATHGLLNNSHPELSGLVLSLVDAQGQAQNGFLRTMDVFNLKLNAELVVLSGCRTGLGKETDGEGLVGLTRGFLYAGSKRVMSSLWNVSDEATAELMRHFYQGLFGEKKLSPSAALRAAQLRLQREKRWRSPYYWAAFVLQGEW